MLLHDGEATLEIPFRKIEAEYSKGFKLIPVATFANMLRDKLKLSGLEIYSDAWVNNATGTIYHGSIEVTGKSMHKLGPELYDKETTFWIGVRTSTNAKYAISFSYGASTKEFKFFSGKSIVSKRQKESLDLAAFFEDGVDIFIKQSDKFLRRVTFLKEKKVSKLEGAGIIMLATQFGMTPRHTTYVFDKWLKGFEDGNKDALYLFSCFDASVSKLGIGDRFEFVSNLYPEFMANLGLDDPE